jgi:hypothetical protein
MPTLPDAGPSAAGPYAGPRRAPVRIGRTRPGTRGPGCLQGCSRSAAVLGSSSWPRSLRGRPASCAWPTAARSGRPSRPPGWPATGLNGIGPGSWARPAAWYHRSCPECDESCQRQRGRQGAAVERDHRSTHRPTHVTDQSVQAPRRWLKRAGSPHPVQRENGAIRRGARPPARPGAPPRLPPAPAPRRRDRRPGSRPRDWWRSARGPGRPGPNTSKVPPSGSWKAAKSASCWLVVRPRTAWRNAPRAGYSLVLVPTQPMHLTRSILVAPPLRSLASAILPRRSWLSWGLASAGQAQVGDGDTAQGGVELPAATAAATMAALFQS